MVFLSSPVNNPYITSPYGQRTGVGSSFHRGIDFGWHKAVEPVYAAHPGVVVGVYYSRGGGNVISIRNEDGSGTDYLHLLNSGLVKPGQRVSRRQRIGTMGNTGSSFGRHLHFQYWVNGKLVNPAPYMVAPAPTPKTPIPIYEEEEMPKNYVDRSTYSGKVPVAGTMCATVFGNGRALVYPRTMVKDPEELATVLYHDYGTHRVVSHEVFTELTKHLVGGDGGDTTVNNSSLTKAEVTAAVKAALPAGITFT